jgi:hypothetical protein
MRQNLETIASRSTNVPSTFCSLVFNIHPSLSKDERTGIKEVMYMERREQRYKAARKKNGRSLIKERGKDGGGGVVKTQNREMIKGGIKRQRTEK